MGKMINYFSPELKAEMIFSDQISSVSLVEWYFLSLF